MEGIRFLWYDGPTCDDTEWDRIENILAARGWMSLNRPTSRILVAEDVDGKIQGFLVLQLCPHTEPLWVAPSARATGLAEELVDRMVKFMEQVQIRGYIATADSPFAAQLCENHGMTKVDKPVYVMVGKSPKGK
jgi:hypothetical protein